MGSWIFSSVKQNYTASGGENNSPVTQEIFLSCIMIPASYIVFEEWKADFL